jgi:hypothetical protein
MKRMQARRTAIQAVLFPIVAALVAAGAAGGCEWFQKPKPYGREVRQGLDAERGEVWAIAPAINLSGQRDVDPLLQADIAYQQLQHVKGLTIIPVNRVAEVYASLRIERVQSAEQAALVCDLLACDALLVPTITLYDPYNPPRLGASMQMFRKPRSYSRKEGVDVRALARAASPPPQQSLPATDDQGFMQAVGMFDATNGTVRDALLAYAAGRNDPLGPMGAKEYFASMERYCGFVYYELIEDLLKQRSRT